MYLFIHLHPLTSTRPSRCYLSPPTPLTENEPSSRLLYIQKTMTEVPTWPRTRHLTAPMDKVRLRPSHLSVHAEHLLPFPPHIRQFDCRCQTKVSGQPPRLSAWRHLSATPPLCTGALATPRLNRRPKPLRWAYIRQYSRSQVTIVCHETRRSFWVRLQQQVSNGPIHVHSHL